MSEYTLEIKQIVDYPRCRIYRQFVQALIADRSIRVSGDSGLFYFVVLRRCDMDHYKDIEEIPMIFGPRELSKILGISKNKTYEVVNRYDFPKIRVGRRIIISKKHFLEWMDANFGKERNNT